MFNKFYLSACIIMILLIFSFSNNQASYLYLSTLDELCKESQEIVICKAQSLNCYYDDEKKDIFTRIDFIIQQNIKSHSLKGNQFTLTLIGGTVGEKSLILPGAPTFEAGKEYLLMLTESANLRFSNPYSIAGGDQGKFDIIDDNATKQKKIFRVDCKAILKLNQNKDSEVIFNNEKEGILLDSFISKLNLILN
ncbi:MAG: hypothetical protein KBA26_01395 [Candidatus Delongbacteria bacterium]|nr:hypothetical protein [Candidatus Delongbacteria bacterium]